MSCCCRHALFALPAAPSWQPLAFSPPRAPSLRRRSAHDVEGPSRSGWPPLGGYGLVFVPGSTDVLVADRQNSRLQLFDRVGRFKRQWTGAKDDQTTGRVFCVDADSDGILYVGIRRADYDTEHTGVLKLDRDWNIVAAIGFGKPGDPVFNAVHDIAVGKDGSIYVAETRTKRVVKLRPVR